MRISLRSIEQAASQLVTWKSTFTMDELCQEIPHLKNLDTIQVTGKVKKVNANLYKVTGELNTLTTYICSRCLKEFTQPLSTEWENELMKDERVDQHAEEQDIRPIEGNEIDVIPLIREALLLKIPYAPICQEDCKGLCSVCGVDQNEVNCTCNNDEIDPRWAKLRILSEEG